MALTKPVFSGAPAALGRSAVCGPPKLAPGQPLEPKAALCQLYAVHCGVPSRHQTRPSHSTSCRVLPQHAFTLRGLPPQRFSDRTLDQTLQCNTRQQTCSFQGRRVASTPFWSPVRPGRGRRVWIWALRVQPAQGTSTRQAVLPGFTTAVAARRRPDACGAQPSAPVLPARSQASSCPSPCLQEALRTFGG